MRSRNPAPQARETRKKVLTESLLRRTMNDIMVQFTGALLSCPSVADYLRDRVESKREEKAEKTVRKHILTASHFLSALGGENSAVDGRNPWGRPSALA